MIFSSDGIQMTAGPDITKHDIRNKVWSFMLEKKFAKFPLPPFNRIPNFEGAGAAGQEVAKLCEFQEANTVKVNPDKPQEEVRFLALQTRKKLLVPTPRLRTGLFNLLENSGDDDNQSLRYKAQSGGVKELSQPLDLDSKMDVDLIVIGSVAVSKTGRRIGKGEGFVDLEYAMMRTMRAITENTPIITTVHDCQVFDDLPSDLFGIHDIPVDIIVTPTKVIKVDDRPPRPEQIYWNILTVEKFHQIPILQTLRDSEGKEGKDVTLKNGDPNDYIPPLSPPLRRGRGRGFRGGRGRFFPPSNDDEDSRDMNTLRRFYKTRQFSRGRGRGLRIQDGTDDAKNDPDFTNIQVTISINKKNVIVNRSVETTEKLDRLGTADHEATPKRRLKQRERRTNPGFSVYIGNIPRDCRFQQLKSAIVERNVKPGYINMRKKFAFIQFGVQENPESVMEKLKHLTLLDQPVVVGLAKDKFKEGSAALKESSYSAHGLLPESPVGTSSELTPEESSDLKIRGECPGEIIGGEVLLERETKELSSDEDSLSSKPTESNEEISTQMKSDSTSEDTK